MLICGMCSSAYTQILSAFVNELTPISSKQPRTLNFDHFTKAPASRIHHLLVVGANVTDISAYNVQCHVQCRLTM